MLFGVFRARRDPRGRAGENFRKKFLFHMSGYFSGLKSSKIKMDISKSAYCTLISSPFCLENQKSKFKGTKKCKLIGKPN